MSAEPRSFVLANTVLAAPPLVPEARLHLASEITPIWEATEAALAQAGVPPPYWAFCWPGGQAVARFLLDHRERVEGARVLDFAAGCGIGAIAAKLAGAAQAVAVDIDPFAAAAMELNAEANGVALDIRLEDVIGRAAGPWDLVITGDVCYERPMAERVAAWLKDLAGGGMTVLMGDPGRNYLPSSGLERLAEYDVPTSLELEDRTLRRTTVWRIAG